MLKTLLLLITSLCLCRAALAEPVHTDMQTTNLHRIIASNPNWLNTSRPLTAEDLQGRIILLDFWTFCCINCMHVIPDLHYLEEKFGDKLTVIGVHSAKFANERDSVNIRNAVLRYDIRHPVVNDADFGIWKGFGVRAWPTFILIGPQGTIAATYSGEGNRDNAARDIETLIAKYGDNINTAPLPLALEADKQPPSILSFPGKLAYGDDKLFVADSGHNRIVVMGLDGTITDTIGSAKIGKDDGDFASASFHTPQGLLYKNNILYITDTDNHELRAADLTTKKVTTLAGNGQQGHNYSANNMPALQTPLASPWDLAFYPDDAHITIAMAGTHQLWSYDIAAKTVSAIAGSGRESIDDGRLPNNSLSQPSGVSATPGGLYFVDSETSSLREFNDGKITTLIGTGLFDFGYKEGKQDVARMQHPLGLAANATGVYIADSYNHSIRRYDVKSTTLSNFAGHGVRGAQDGPLAQSSFNEPGGVVEIDGKLYIADTNNNAIRIIDIKAGKVSTLTINEPSQVTYSTDLPNADTAPLNVAANAPIILTLGLQKGWHINKEAPSFLALFDADKKPVASFDATALQAGKLALPALPEGSYRLQATLYYCADKTGSQCLLKSFDSPVTVKKGGNKMMALKVN